MNKRFIAIGGFVLGFSISAGARSHRPATKEKPAARAEEQDMSRVLFKRGLANYERGSVALNEGRKEAAAKEFEEAIKSFQAAKMVAEHALPELDYNIGRCYERWGKLMEAAAAYQDYLNLRPNAPEADELHEKVKGLVALYYFTHQTPKAEPPPPAVEKAPASTAIATPSPSSPTAIKAPPEPVIERAIDEQGVPIGDHVPPRPSWAKRYRWPLAFGGAALAVGITGTALVLSVKPGYDDLLVTCKNGCPDSAWTGLETRATTGYALWGAAGLLAAVDVALFIMDWKKSRRDEAPRVSFVPGIGSVHLFGRF